MNGPRAVVVVLALFGLLVLGGCRGAERAAAPAPTTPAVGRTVPTGAAAGSGDPLGDLEASVDAVARDLESDADADRDPGR